MSMFRSFSCSQVVADIEAKKKFLIEYRRHMTSIKLVIEDGMENTKKRDWNVDITLACIYRGMHIHIYIYCIIFIHTNEYVCVHVCVRERQREKKRGGERKIIFYGEEMCSASLDYLASLLF